MAGTHAYLHQPQTAELRWLGETSTYFLATGAETAETFALVEEQAQQRRERAAAPAPGRSGVVLRPRGRAHHLLRRRARRTSARGVVRARTRWTRSRLPNRIGDGALPDPDDAAPRRVLPRHHAGLSTGRLAATRVGRRCAAQGGVPRCTASSSSLPCPGRQRSEGLAPRGDESGVRRRRELRRHREPPRALRTGRPARSAARRAGSWSG